MQIFDWIKMKFPGFILILLLSSILCRADKIEFRYWFNQNSDNAQSITYTPGTGSISIPIQTDNNGPFNVLNIQVKNTDGVWSVPYRKIFNTPVIGNLELSCILDGREINVLEDDKIDVSDFYSGLHKLCIVGRKMAIPATTALFYKNSVQSDNLKLALSSYKNKVNKAIPINRTDTECFLDVEALTPGIYPVNISITDTVTGSLVAISCANVEIKPVSGNRLTDVYYWLNDSLHSHRDFKTGALAFPVTKSIELPLANWNIPSLDYHLSFIGGKPHIAPKYDLTLSFRNTYGFAADSTKLITDNSKRVELHAIGLNGSKQHDLDKWRTDSCYWYQFNAINGDNIMLSTRLRCKLKLYSPEAVLLDSAQFDLKNKELRKRLEATGTYYLQLSEIEQSRQEFSVLLTYLSGPSLNNQTQVEPSYDGIPIEWKKATDWLTQDNQISITTKGLKMTVDGTRAQYKPHVTANSLICHTYKDNIIGFSSEGYIEKVTLCLPNVPDYIYPTITTPSGNIEIDTVFNTIVWTGFSHKAELCVAGKADETLIPLKKAYVKISEISESEITLNDDQDDYAGLTYDKYNLVRIWRSGIEEASYEINNKTKISFVDNELIIITGGKEYRHSTSNKLILTFEYKIITDIDKVKTYDDSPEVRVYNENLLISGLPDYVEIFSISGIIHYQGYVNEREFTYPLSNLQTGVYIVRVGNKSTKILIP